MPEHNANLTDRLDQRMPDPDAVRVGFLADDLTRRAGATRHDVTVSTETLAGLPYVMVVAASGAGFTAAPWGNSPDAWAIHYSHAIADQTGHGTGEPARMVMPDYDRAAAYMYGLLAALAPAPF